MGMTLDERREYERRDRGLKRPLRKYWLRPMHKHNRIDCKCDFQLIREVGGYYDGYGAKRRARDRVLFGRAPFFGRRSQ